MSDSIRQVIIEMRANVREPDEYPDKVWGWRIDQWADDLEAALAERPHPQEAPMEILTESVLNRAGEWCREMNDFETTGYTPTSLELKAQGIIGDFLLIVAPPTPPAVIPLSEPKCIHGHNAYVIWYCPTCERNYQPAEAPAVAREEPIEGDVFALAALHIQQYPASYRVFKAEVERLKGLEAENERLRAERDKWLKAFNESEQFQNGPTKRAEKAEAELSAKRSALSGLIGALVALPVAGHEEYVDGHCRATVFKADVAALLSKFKRLQGEKS